MPLSHFDSRGGSKMVDVGAKTATDRLARASARVLMQPETLQLIQDKQLAKGDVFEVSRLAGIMAAKRTDSLIPLCHTLPLESVSVTFEVESSRAIKIIAETTTHAKTGVEMEALVAASTAALCLYDMCKAVDRGMRIEQVQLEEKLGGKSGHFVRTSASDETERR